MSRLEDEKCQLLCQVASLQERLKHVESKSSDLGRDIESKNHQVLHLKDMMAVRFDSAPRCGRVCHGARCERQSKEKAAESNRLRLLSEIEGVVIAMHRQAKRAGLDMLPGVATLVTEDVKVDVADPEAHPRVLLSVETQTEADEAMSAPAGTVQPVQPVPAAELPVGGGDGDAAQGGAIKVGCDECDSRKAENDAIRDEFQKLNEYGCACCKSCALPGSLQLREPSGAAKR